MTIKKTRVVVTETVTTEYEKAEAGAQKRDRVFTVGNLDSAPFIRMRGHWLEEAGFHTGDKLAVSVNENRLVIERLEEKETDVMKRTKSGQQQDS